MGHLAAGAGRFSTSDLPFQPSIHFLPKEMEVQRGLVTCLRSHSVRQMLSVVSLDVDLVPSVTWLPVLQAQPWCQQQLCHLEFGSAHSPVSPDPANPRLGGLYIPELHISAVIRLGFFGVKAAWM